MNLTRAFLLMSLLASNALAASGLTAEQLDPLFAEYNKPNVPGASVAVLKDGKPLIAKGYGLADLEKGVPCSTNTDFRLASVSKQFTAMAVLMLVEGGKLSLDDRLTDIFPEFPAYGRDITIRQLLNHTSGLIDYEDVIPKGTEIPVIDRDVLRLLMQQDNTYFPPGTKYKYSNSAYSLLALVVEARSGSTFPHFLAENIFGPLKMTQTLAYQQGSSVIPHRAYGYTEENGTFKRTDQSLTSSVLGDGGIYSCVDDLAKWDEALYGKGQLKPKLMELAFTPNLDTDHADTKYGFGWYLGQYRGLKEIWHSGTSRGFSTRISRIPEKHFTVIILTNRNDAHLADLPHKIADLVLFK